MAKHAPPRYVYFKMPSSLFLLLFYATSFFLLKTSPIFAVEILPYSKKNIQTRPPVVAELLNF